MIDVHIRVSRTLVFCIVGVVVLLTVLGFVFATVGHSSGGVKIGPVQTQSNP